MTQTIEETTLSEARERYAGEWLAMEVVSRSENGRPERVRVVDHAGTRIELHERIRSQSGLYIAYAGPVVPPGQAALYGTHLR